MLYVFQVCTHPGTFLSVAAPAGSVHGWGAGGGGSQADNCNPAVVADARYGRTN